jgi:hypothetical protein
MNLNRRREKEWEFQERENKVWRLYPIVIGHASFVMRSHRELQLFFGLIVMSNTTILD